MKKSMRLTKRVWFAIFLFLALAGQSQTDAKQQAIDQYIRRYSPVAVKEMKEYHIPASITLAQGIIESDAGRSDLASQANNHFGIKCHKEWSGPTFIKDDETRNECFRKYDDPLESFRDHSRFLAERDRYKSLFNLKTDDYKGWARGLKTAGYATNPAYADMLIRTIETYDLQRFDDPVTPVPEPGNIAAESIVSPAGWAKNLKKTGKAADGRVIYENNRLRMVFAGPDEDLYSLAKGVGLSVYKLMKYNELTKATALCGGQAVYLEGKRRKAEPRFHKIETGETIYSISQRYGIRIKMIVRRNSLQEGVEPGAGMVLRLR